MSHSVFSSERAGVLIACASPSQRVQLASRYIDHEPVILAAGSRGLLHHVRRALAGRAVLPARIVVGAAERGGLEDAGLIAILERAGVEVLDAWAPLTVAA